VEEGHRDSGLPQALPSRFALTAVSSLLVIVGEPSACREESREIGYKAGSRSCGAAVALKSSEVVVKK
jgi:hypothetical protein